MNEEFIPEIGKLVFRTETSDDFFAVTLCYRKSREDEWAYEIVGSTPSYYYALSFQEGCTRRVQTNKEGRVVVRSLASGWALRLFFKVFTGDSLIRNRMSEVGHGGFPDLLPQEAERLKDYFNICCSEIKR